MFDFVDLFSGVGGFHAALAGLGGRAVQACEIDPRPAAVYELNWGLRPTTDVRLLAADPQNLVPDHSLLAGGFPCQPFSKSGRQLGVAEERGTLFQDVIRILEVKQPAVVMLENVRNIAGRRQEVAWTSIVEGLRAAGYQVSSRPCVFSPHLLSPQAGGAPQVRDRVYIMGVRVGRAAAQRATDVPPAVQRVPVEGWDPSSWRIEQHALLPELPGGQRKKYALTADEVLWIDTWNELLGMLGSHVRLPGFPLWEPVWRHRRPTGYADMPTWKQGFVDKNMTFYRDNRVAIDAWRDRPREVPVSEFPLSRRKLEWQAQDGGQGGRDMWKQLVQLRPSGIRVKQPTWTPALVAMNQTSIYGPQRRRLTPLETARLQGFDPETFTFGDQPDSASYKQMGNAVHVGAVRHVLREFVRTHEEQVRAAGGGPLADAVLGVAAPVR